MTTSDWDNTPWAGTPVERRLTYAYPPNARKASTGGVWLNGLSSGIQITALHGDWQARAAAYLAAYKVGWFYKGGARIARDFSNLAWTLAYEDGDGDNEDEITAPANNVPFDALGPLEQFLRLSERPNPYQNGRELKHRQLVRFLFTGRACYYLENADMGLPTGLYGVSPTRLWPSLGKDGRRIGWVLDKNRPDGGIPFGNDEILVVEEPGAEDEPQGIVEAVYDHAALNRAVPRHIVDVLATGGRMAGMVTPKDRALNEDEFQDALRAWRNVTSDPNAARRLLLFPEPMEYTAAASTPAEIGIPELANLSRDDILTAFPISPYMLGVPMPGGLNSAETRKEERHDYWEMTIHPRVEVFEDAFQTQVLPKYEEAVGRPLDFDIEEPDLDDAASLQEKAKAVKELWALGFEPKEAIAAAGLDDIKWEGMPDLLDPAKQAEAARAATEALANRPAEPMQGQPKPQMPKALKARRDEVVGTELPGFRASMRQFLDDQAARLAEDIERVIGPLTKSQRKALPDDWWDQKREDQFLRDHLRGLYVRLSRSALTVVSNDTDRVVTPERIRRVTEQMLDAAGERITGINETTRKAVAEQVGEGVRRGYSIAQIVNGQPAEDYRGVRGASAFDEARAELVARTETMLAYNESALRGYAEFGIREVEAIDGDDDDECRDRVAANPWTVDDALAELDHPNGTLDWAPLTN